jgi:hypothetical protein
MATNIKYNLFYELNGLKGYLAGDSLTASTKLPLSSDTTEIIYRKQ